MREREGEREREREREGGRERERGGEIERERLLQLLNPIGSHCCQDKSYFIFHHHLAPF